MSGRILSANLGIGQIITGQTEIPHLPLPREVVSAEVERSSLDQLFPLNAQDQDLAAAVAPRGLRPELLQPPVLRALLAHCTEVLSTVRDPAVRSFVRNDLKPLMDNTDLMRAYSSMLSEA